MGQLDNDKAIARAQKAKATRIENARREALENERLAKETERELSLRYRLKVKTLTLLSPIRATRCQDQSFKQPWFVSIYFKTWNILPHDSLARQQGNPRNSEQQASSIA